MGNARSAKRKLTAAPKPKEDIEALAVKAKGAREQKCIKEVNALLEKYRCNLSVTCQIGGASIPLDQLFKFGASISLVSK